MIASVDVMPQDVMSERAVIGSCILDPRVIDDVALVVRPEMFFDECNRELMTAILAMQAANKKIDSVTLAHWLKKTKRWEQSGGAAHLVACMETVQMAAHWDYYSEIVRSHWMRREGIHAATEIHQAMLDSTDSAAAVISRAETVLTNLIESVDRDATTQSIGSIMIDLKVIFDCDEQPAAGLMTGIGDMDEITGGFRPAEMTIVAARPSVGKTALALNFMKRWTKEGTPVLFISLEQSKTEVAMRLLSMELGQSVRDIEERRPDAIQMQTAFEEMFERPLWIDDRGGLTILQIESIARLSKRKHDIRAIVIDYLQLVEPADPRLPREQQVSTNARRLKALAKSLDIPVIVLAQLNREVEKVGTNAGDSSKGKPKLSHLRESGAIEQDADKVLLLWRPFMDDASHARHNEAHALVAKNRNGKVGQVDMIYLESCFTFRGQFIGDNFNF